jgi:hypothetical protein
VSRVTPVPIQVFVHDRWYRGKLRSCEVSEDGTTCSSVVSFVMAHGVQTGRFAAARMRSPSGEPGCPVDHDDQTCGKTGTLATHGVETAESGH